MDSLRGIAAFLVVLFHFPQWNPFLYSLPFIRNGYLMVEVFFVLSGYVICSAYFEKLGSTKELAKFQFLRFARLYPVHLVMLLACLGIEFAKLVADRQFGLSEQNTVPFIDNNLIAFLQQLLLIHAIYPTGNAASFNGVAWSISVEFYLYAMFGILLVTVRRFATVMFCLIALLAFFALSIFDSVGGWIYLTRGLCGFFLGCALARLLAISSLRLPAGSALIGLVAIVAFLWLKPYKVMDFWIFPLAAFLIVAILRAKPDPIHGLLRSPSLYWLGLVSYSLYMVHQPVMWAITQVHRVILGKPIAGTTGRLLPQLGIAEALVTYAITLAIVLWLSHLMYAHVENPWRKKSRTFLGLDQVRR